MRNLGEAIALKTNYAIKRISQIKGLNVPVLNGAHFKEFTVNFDGLNAQVSDVNKALYRDYAILGGKDLSGEYPELGQNSLYCITELHTLEDIERLISALSEIAERRW